MIRAARALAPSQAKGVPMITFVRTVEAMPGKIRDLVIAGKEIVAIHKRLFGTDLAIATAFGGNVSEVAFISRYDSVQGVADMLAKLTSDKAYADALKPVAAAIVPGSGRDHIWEHR
jgi:hypothetical protein